jgi:hypothetical protein
MGPGKFAREARMLREAGEQHWFKVNPSVSGISFWMITSVALTAAATVLDVSSFISKLNLNCVREHNPVALAVAGFHLIEKGS